MLNLQEQVNKAFCYQQLFSPFTVWINCSKVGNKWDNFFLTLRQDGHRFLQVMSHFRGFEPHLRRYFFYEIWYQMGFFTYFDILESYVINLLGHYNLKTQRFVKNYCIITIAIYSCILYNVLLKIFLVWQQGSMV